MPHHHDGRHEHGQNHLTDPRAIARFIDAVRETSGPILEIGPGGGALTLDLQGLARPLTAVEIDERRVRALRRQVDPRVRIVHGDILRHRLPDEPHVVVGNLPFHLTTAILRKLLHAPGWTEAVLVVQWEVARRRAAVGGSSMMTAQWWPWVDFGVRARIPARAFDPVPGADAGLLALERRATPLVDIRRQTAYRDFVHRVFTGRGRGIEAVLAGVVGSGRRPAVRQWLAREGIAAQALPKELTAVQWADLFVELGPVGAARQVSSGGRSRSTSGRARGRSRRQRPTSRGRSRRRRR